MKKFIVFCIVIIATLAYGLYHKKQLAIWFSMNDHQQAAHQYWFNAKHSLDEQGSTPLPFKKSVKTFSYDVREPVQQDGKYYFETVIYINNIHHLPLYTVVEPVNGVWVVNTDATFATSGDATIQFYTDMYKATLSVSKEYLAQEQPAMNAKDLESFVDGQLENIKKILLDTYQATDV